MAQKHSGKKKMFTKFQKQNLNLAHGHVYMAFTFYLVLSVMWVMWSIQEVVHRFYGTDAIAGTSVKSVNLLSVGSWKQKFPQGTICNRFSLYIHELWLLKPWTGFKFCKIHQDEKIKLISVETICIPFLRVNTIWSLIIHFTF